MRTIKIYSTVGLPGEIVTNVTTLRELKPLLAGRGIDYSGMKLVVGETRNELSIDEAELPAGDFKLYLMPQKTKSGGIDDDIEDIQETVNDNNRLLASQGIQLNRIESKIDKLLSSGGSIASVSNLSSKEDEAAMADMAKLMGEDRAW